MAKQPKKSEMSRDLVGGALFMVGSFTLVLVVMSLINAAAEGRAPRGTAALAARIVAAGGQAAPMLGGFGLIVIGAMIVLRSRAFPIGRHLLGCLGTAFGLCVLLGAVTDAGGGAIGGAIGGGATRALSIGIGAVVGFAALIVPAWMAWSRDVARLTRNFPEGRTASMANTDVEGQGGGVSAAEAEALVPDAKTLAYMEQALQKARAHQPPPAPQHDPRLQGHVPLGATALDPSDAKELLQRPPQAAANRWRPAKAGDGPDIAAGADLATEAAAAPVALGEQASHPPVQAGVAEAEARAESAPEARLGTPESVRPARPATAVSAAVATPIEGARVLLSDGPPTPSWEQPDLFGEEDPPIEAEAAETVAGDDEESETDEAVDEVAESDEEDEDEDEEDDLDDEEDEEEDEDLDEEEDEEDEEEDEEEEEDLDEEDEDEEDAREVAAAPEQEPAAEDESPRLGESLAEEEPVSPASPDEEPDPSERDVILVPPPARAPEPAPTAAASPPRLDRTPADLEDLVYQAGAHFLERGRVAVSLLQRNFNLDFDDACEVLDELQTRGLIGPYLGGQRRDILLTLEEWTEKVTSA